MRTEILLDDNGALEVDHVCGEKVVVIERKYVWGNSTRLHTTKLMEALQFKYPRPPCESYISQTCGAANTCQKIPISIGTMFLPEHGSAGI
jgi:hypothetical protein